MASVGEQLKTQRETRAMTIEQLAVATGVSVVYLRAMENAAFEDLPGRAFGKLYIRAYADVLEFDPKPMIEEYDREQRLASGDPKEAPVDAPAGARPVAEAIARWKASKRTAVEEPPVEPPPEPAVEPPAAVVAAAPAKRSIAPLLAVVSIVTAAVLYVVLRGPGIQRSVITAPPGPPPIVQPPPALSPASTPAQALPQPTAIVSALTVPEYGVGRRLAHGRIEGDGLRFAEGEVAWFQTRVLGGKPGEFVRHVWIFDGRAQQSIPLRLGASDWRTQSSKTIYHAGSWTVEARDAGGHVLATASFTCARPDR